MQPNLILIFIFKYSFEIGKVVRVAMVQPVLCVTLNGQLFQMFGAYTLGPWVVFITRERVKGKGRGNSIRGAHIQKRPKTRESARSSKKNKCGYVGYWMKWLTHLSFLTMWIMGGLCINVRHYLKCPRCSNKLDRVVYLIPGWNASPSFPPSPWY